MIDKRRMTQWEKQYGYVREYYTAYRKWPDTAEEYPRGNALGKWCDTQRQAFRNKRLKKSRLQHLLAIEFSFLDEEEKWCVQYDLLLEYLALHGGHFPKDGTQFPPGNFLGQWCKTQRRAFYKKEISKAQFTRLCDIHFPWTALNSV